MAELVEILPEFEDDVFDQVANLFNSMYCSMNEQGLNIPLIEGGAEKYIHAIKRTLGKNNYLVGAFDNKKLIGFGIGTLRLTPPYLGNLKLGAISHIYINPSNRTKGLGNNIYSKIEKWLLEKNIHSIELEVLYENESGISFWKKNGFKPELYKMRKYC